jgi:hypothetical protein
MGINFTLQDLEDTGVLPDSAPVDEAAKGLLLRLTEAELSVLTALYQAGEEGLSLGQLKPLEKKYPTATLTIETMGFVELVKNNARQASSSDLNLEGA